MTTVTVSTRLSRRLLRDRARASEHLEFWETPDILPWRAWVARAWEELVYAGREERMLLSSAQELVLWEQAIRNSPENEELLNPAGAAQSAAMAWRQLHDYRIPPVEAAFAEIPDTAAFFGWMQSFRGALESRDFITEAQLPEALLANRVRGPEFLAGFDEMTPIQRALFEGAEPVLEPGIEPESQYRIPFPDSEREMEAAARWARERLTQSPECRIGILIPDLAQRRAAVHRIFLEVLGTEAAFHISAPVPLAETPLAHGALLALRLSERLTLAEAGQLLRSPYFPHGAESAAKTDAELRRAGLNEIATLPQFPTRAPREDAKRPSQWAMQFTQHLKSLGWPGPRTLSSPEYQALQSWKQLLSEFAKLDHVLAELDLGSALVRLAQLAGGTDFNPENELEPIQILDVPESAGASFDALWLAGLHDGAWPAPARPNPFIPLALQRAAGVTNSSIERQYAQAERVTARWFQSAGQIVASYPQRDGEAALRPSPFLQDLRFGEAAAFADEAGPVRLEEITGDLAPPLGSNRHLSGGMSVIQDQSACPFRAFATHRLAARPLDAVEPGLTDTERGMVTHKALELIWRRLKSQKTLLETSAGDLRALVESSVREALREKLGQGSRGLTQIQSIEQQRLTGILLEWLDGERARPGFEIHALEHTHQQEIGGLHLTVRADRVDRYANGSVAIIDYKTGTSSDPKQWEDARPEAPQLPLYSILMPEGKVSTVAFAQLAVGKLQLKGISDQPEPGCEQDPPAARIPQWRATLEALARDFAEGKATVSPTKVACEYCELPSLCRVHETGRLNQDEENNSPGIQLRFGGLSTSS